MKTLKIFLSLFLLAVFPYGSAAQSTSRQSFWIHEDQVKPSKVMEYESIAKELIGHLKKHNIQEVNFMANSMDDNRYIYIGPLANMADLDVRIFDTLSEKMGKESFNDLFARMDACYDVERDYVIHLEPDLSYMPNGISMTTEGADYRTYHFLHYAPANRALVRQKIEAIRDLFAKKGSKEYYRIYRSGFGTPNEYYMVAVSAKNAADQEAMASANNELLGDEGKKAFGELFGSLLRYEKFTGRMRPDLFYQPQ